MSALRSWLLTLAPKPMPPASVLRCWMILSRPANAPPQMNRMLRGVDLQEFLLRMLAAALRRHRGDGAFDQLQQRLLHALAGHVAGDRRVFGLARDLVDLVDVDDARLRLLDVVVALLQQLLDDVLDVLADVAGFGQRGGVGDGERHIEQARQRFRQQRLARAGRADQQDVGLGQLDVVVLAAGSRCACSGCRPPPTASSWRAAGRSRTGRARRGSRAAWAAGCARPAPSPRSSSRMMSLHSSTHSSQMNTLRARDQLAHLVLALAAERAVEDLAAVAGYGPGGLRSCFVALPEGPGSVAGKRVAWNRDCFENITASRCPVQGGGRRELGSNHAVAAQNGLNRPGCCRRGDATNLQTSGWR